MKVGNRSRVRVLSVSGYLPGGFAFDGGVFRFVVWDTTFFYLLAMLLVLFWKGAVGIVRTYPGDAANRPNNLFAGPSSVSS